MTLDEFRAKEQTKNREVEAKMQRQWQDFEALDGQKKQKLLPCLRRATREDYVQWLKGFLQQGGMPTHNYSYPMAQAPFYVARQDFTLLPLCGALAVHIIVPIPWRSLGGDPGHCILYLEERYQAVGTYSWVPVYSDLKL